MKTRNRIEKILLNDYGCFDDFMVDKLCDLFNIRLSLPNDIDLNMLANLLKYSNKYEISIQFYPSQTAVYIAKDDVDLIDFGGDFEFAIGSSIAYLDRITGNK